MFTKNDLGPKGRISVDFLKGKGKSKFEAFLHGDHGLTFQPDDFKLARGGQGPWCRDRRLETAYNQ